MSTVSVPAPVGLAVSQPAAEEAIWFLRSLLIVKATGETTGGVFDMVEELLPPGFSPPPHIHHREEECFYVISGQMTFTCGEQMIEATPGTFVVLPRGVIHSFRVERTEPARTLMINTPAGLIGFFRDAGQPAPSRTLPPPSPPDLEKLRHAAIVYGCEIPGLTDR